MEMVDEVRLPVRLGDRNSCICARQAGRQTCLYPLQGGMEPTW